MEDAYEWKGLNGQLVTFKKEVGDAQKITYIGSPGVCTPFAEFLAYSVRDKENHFFPLLNVGECHEFESKSYAMILKEDGRIIGVCFMDMFAKAGWLDKVDFDCVIDGTLIGVVMK